MKVKVNLSLGDKSDAQVIIDGRQIVMKMEGNTNFNQPGNPITPILPFVSAAVDDLEKALTEAQDTGPATTQVLYQKRNVLDSLLTRLGHYVEDTANDPALTDDKREGIIISAGMMVKTQTTRQKQHFEAKNADLSGTVYLVAGGIDRGAHEWEYTADVANLTDRISLVPTTRAYTEIHGLVSGTKYAFFHRAIMPGEISDWEGPVFLMVV